MDIILLFYILQKNIIAKVVHIVKISHYASFQEHHAKGGSVALISCVILSAILLQIIGSSTKL
jgi:hypothetical protein